MKRVVGMLVVLVVAVIGCSPATPPASAPPTTPASTPATTPALSPKRVPITETDGYKKYVEESNRERRRLGLREVKPDWVYSRMNTNRRKRWKVSEVGPPHKVVYKEKGKLTSEHDYYYSGRKVRDEDPDGGMMDERLCFVYDYTKKTITLYCFTDNHRLEELAEGLGYENTDMKRAIEVAESILKEWGVPRL